MRARVLLVATALAVTATAPHVHAQPEPVVKDGKVTITLMLHPTDYLKPVSRGYLLPDFSEAIPGNRVQMFLRCFMEQDTFFGKQETERRDKWGALPLKELPILNVKEYGGRLVKQEMYDAARMTQADWQLWYFLRRDSYGTLLPDVQKMRALAGPIKTRLRGEIASGDFPAALHSFKTLLGLSRTLEAHPTLIGDLVGIAIAAVGMNAVEEFIQQPTAPNLFWSLTDLPRPFISLRLGLEGERLMPSVDFEKIRSPEHSVDDATILKLIEHLDEILHIEAPTPERPQVAYKAAVLARVGNAAEVSAARKRLAQAGLDASATEHWSPLRVTAVDDILYLEQFRDEVGKFMNLPYYEAKPRLDEQLVLERKETKERPILNFVTAFAKVKQSQARLEQRIAYLQVIEAIRLHAFQNGGALPATLADIKLPLPVDPVSGKPFEYSVEKGAATLHGQNPGTDAITNLYYVILLRK